MANFLWSVTGAMSILKGDCVGEQHRVGIVGCLGETPCNLDARRTVPLDSFELVQHGKDAFLPWLASRVKQRPPWIFPESLRAPAIVG